MRREITVHPHKLDMGATWAETFKRMIREEIITPEIPKVDVYTLEGKTYNFNAGRVDRRLVILANATFAQADFLDQEHKDEGAVINGLNTEYTTFLPPLNNEETVVIRSEEGINLAEYKDETLNILFDITKHTGRNEARTLRYIMKKLDELVYQPRLLKNSWIYSNEIDELKKTLFDDIQGQIERQTREDKDRLQMYERKISDYKRELKNAWESSIRLRQAIELGADNASKLEKQMVSDMDNIAKLPQVKDIQIINRRFEVLTHDMYMYSSDNHRYYLGKMKIIIDPRNTDVQFKNLNNARRGFWAEDPHPHVDGTGGNPCLGNVASTIAELSAKNEIYALTLVAIDFLENANVDDPAGKKVRMWDEVNEEGDVIREGGMDEDDDEDNEDNIICDVCDESVHMDDIHQVYEHASRDRDGDLNAEELSHVCEDCREQYYSHHDELDEHVHVESDIWDEEEEE